MDESNSEALLSVKEYAALFQVTENGVYIAIRKDRFRWPVVRPLGDAIRIRVPAALVKNLRAA